MRRDSSGKIARYQGVKNISTVEDTLIFSGIMLQLLKQTYTKNRVLMILCGSKVMERPRAKLKLISYISRHSHNVFKLIALQ